MPWMNNNKHCGPRRAYVARLGVTALEKWEEIERGLRGIPQDHRLLGGHRAGSGDRSRAPCREGGERGQVVDGRGADPWHSSLPPETSVHPQNVALFCDWRADTPVRLAYRAGRGNGRRRGPFHRRAGVESPSSRTSTGWRRYGEVSLQIGIDRSGHVAFSATYKRGSAPPTFGDINTVQSGLAIKYSTNQE